MKNSKLRRIFFELKANLKHFKYGLKNKDSFKCSNELSPITGRFWTHQYQLASGIQSDKYLSETYYHNRVEGKLNNYNVAGYFDHKGYIDTVLGSHTIKCIINKISNCIYNENGEIITVSQMVDILTEEDGREFVVKVSSGTGGGIGVTIGTFSEVKTAIEKLLNNKTDFIIQPLITQHQELKKFNPTSINTLRIMTMRCHGDIHFVSAILRMGNGGRVDNASSGGISIGMDHQGKLNNRGFNYALDKIFYTHPFSKIDFSDDHYVPYFNEIVALVKEKHQQLKSQDLVSWDITVDQDGVISIVEYNILWSDISFHQANNGPVFEPFFDFIKELNDKDAKKISL
ncbi:hypothetical protein AYY19_13020 [Photobacterium aquimaris]|uniref:Alpha-L-glutamate ligase-related protein ATP-grasp domain-containing protein n=1 Tax=Photobacterium aquimaris TaxID=512643 RepID=A0A2T3IQP9_9GAMM|nr:MULTISPECIES: sugar-transfer associated ATP-grasp domain-containing protein [Photobacterium]OBU17113.1 hypothetical protein AYY20_05635 [Photobacterium aquimaris]OBU17576.1 hypothetical protein AYY19_13020 [Photobacterium aquimaris]PSU30681.1 hypothetical protein CTM88_03490 [Photobacterium aquimaris]PSV98890.1 hypothetical protein CTM91_15290 [Photobacterium aquimaris]